MKIIKHSDNEKKYYTFTCKCGCIFQCDEDEYWTKPQVNLTGTTATYSSTKTFITCCPECHKIVERYAYDNISCTCDSTEDCNRDNIFKSIEVTCDAK